MHRSRPFKSFTRISVAVAGLWLLTTPCWAQALVNEARKAAPALKDALRPFWGAQQSVLLIPSESFLAAFGVSRILDEAAKGNVDFLRAVDPDLAEMLGTVTFQDSGRILIDFKPWSSLPEGARDRMLADAGCLQQVNLMEALGPDLAATIMSFPAGFREGDGLWSTRVSARVFWPGPFAAELTPAAPHPALLAKLGYAPDRRITAHTYLDHRLGIQMLLLKDGGTGDPLALGPIQGLGIPDKYSIGHATGTWRLKDGSDTVFVEFEPGPGERIARWGRAEGTSGKVQEIHLGQPRRAEAPGQGDRGPGREALRDAAGGNAGSRAR